MIQLSPRVFLAIAAALLPFSVLASDAALSTTLDLTGHWAGFAALAVFFIAYGLVIAEETLHLRKSKPVMVGAGIIWVLVAFVYAQHGDTHTAETAVRHNLLEFAELFLFLLAAMTYINAMDERGVFDLLRVKLVTRGYSLRTIFWITGALSFSISPVADNLTTALLLSTVAIAVGGQNKKFVGVACINIVIAANAGGAFSPFGDITTLMVWQKGLVDFAQFFHLFIPAVVNWLVPAAIMSLTIGKGAPDPVHEEATLQHGAWVIVGLFLLTIVMAVCAHNFLHLPPVMGMMTGLGLLKFFGYYLKRRAHFFPASEQQLMSDRALALDGASSTQKINDGAKQYNIFKSLERAEWDTLMFFYGVILCVGGLGTMGYLALGSQLMYGQLGPTTANILIGFLSAVVDNIPVMFAVLAMRPDMDHGQWMLVTLTAGVGGSLLSVGSAAGVAVMGQARGVYTFFSHLKWTWAILLGYAASIWVHFLVNASLFH
ncbi:sodium:proton antiporter NhaD [Candidatus Accumulibacter sp. ACC003]|uniref:sodium:proton antiporter NhaD n=1 Tax=Candidatus Accumulibacter sp. ACC003 TaxID=2823334 RepID=UPI0025C2E2DF|nr:sodium:proton antiporter NhaD [Candidatus Accumulibacter sp. ACC003]